MNKHHVKVQYDKFVRPRRFSEGYLVLLWDQDKEPLGEGKVNPMWHGPYVVKHVLDKGAYELVDYEGTSLAEPRNGVYLKKYYAQFSARANTLYIIIQLHSVVLVPLW